MSEGKFRIIIPNLEFWQKMIPCQTGCPVRTDSGRYVQLIAEGKNREAYFTARSPNPIVSICGRVCAAPCEDKCRRGKIDAPVAIRALKRFITERYGVESLEPETQNRLFEGETEEGNKFLWHLPGMSTGGKKNRASGQKVAVIGAGPAGLGCAHDLSIMGYQVTIFEATGLPGGMMYHGIPEFRLSRSLIQKEIEKITALGSRIKYDSPLSATFGIRELKAQGFEAIFLALGTQKGREMSVEGANLDGVVKAIEYLINVNNGYRVQLGKRVIVIGGGLVAFDAARIALRAGLSGENGNQPELPPGGASLADLIPGQDLETAMDAARAAIRAGVRDVRMVSLESLAELPAMRSAQGKEEFEEAEREGVQFHPQRAVKKFIGENGKLKAVEFMGVKRTYDESGRFHPEYDADVHEVLEADSVILAIGQQADLSFLKPEDGITTTPQGTIKVDPASLATSAPCVFAGGDVAFGPRTLIEAVSNGKRAAQAIHEHLRKISLKPAVRLTVDKLPTRSYKRPEGYERQARQAPPTVSLNRRTGISDVEVSYSEEEARQQAERCLACHIQTIYNAELCVLCNRCVDICPEFCLKLVPLDELDLDPATRQKIIESSGLPPGQVLSAMIKDDEKCIRCGLCATRCPVDAMTMEVFNYEERESGS